MLEDTLIGFSQKKEYLPKDFDEFNSLEKLRKLFLNLSNNILKSYCYFSKYEQNLLCNFCLENAFFIQNKKYASNKFYKDSKSYKL